MDLTTAGRFIKDKLRPILTPMKGKVPTLCFERQLSVGAEASAMQFAAQMMLLDFILDIVEPTNILMPLPTQLKSYIKKVHHGDTSNKTGIVRTYTDSHAHKGRISSHCVEAYYLCRLARDVLDGRWRYNLPSKETALIPGTIINGLTSAPR